MALSDRVTVFRAGKIAGEMKTSETNPQALADLMVGRKVALKLDLEAGAVGAGTGEPSGASVSARIEVRPVEVIDRPCKAHARAGTSLWA